MITSAPATAEMTTAAEALLGPTVHDSFSILGDVITIVLSQAQTGDTLTIMEVRSPPGGGMPVLHAHPGAKTFVGLAGTYDIYGETEGEPVTLMACPGTTVHVPSEAPHGYANVGGTPGRMLVLVHGENRLEAFIREVGVPLDDASAPLGEGGATAGLDRLRDVIGTYDIRIVDDLWA